MRHRLEVILVVAVGAVLSGARSLLVIGQWAASLDAEARLPEESTIRRVLSSAPTADTCAGPSKHSRHPHGSTSPTPTPCCRATSTVTTLR